MSNPAQKPIKSFTTTLLNISQNYRVNKLNLKSKTLLIPRKSSLSNSKIQQATKIANVYNNKGWKLMNNHKLLWASTNSMYNYLIRLQARNSSLNIIMNYPNSHLIEINKIQMEWFNRMINLPLIQMYQSNKKMEWWIILTV